VAFDTVSVASTTFLSVREGAHVVLDFELLTAGGIRESGNCQVTFPTSMPVSQVSLKVDPD